MTGSFIKRLKGQHIQKRNKKYLQENQQTEIAHPLPFWEHFHLFEKK